MFIETLMESNDLEITVSEKSRLKVVINGEPLLVSEITVLKKLVVSEICLTALWLVGHYR